MSGPFILNRAQETTTSTGTGAKNLAGAAPGKQSIAAAAIELSGDAVGPWLVELFIADNVDWEIGEYEIETGTPDTATPVRIIASTNGGAAVDWGAGTRNVVSGPSAQSLGSVFGMAPETELTIAAGVVAPRFSIHSIDTEADAASDNLDTLALTYMRDSAFLLIRPVNDSRTVVVRHNQGTTGKIMLNGAANFTMDEVGKYLLLKRTGTYWEEVGRSFGSDTAAMRAFMGFGTASEADTGTGAGDVPVLNADGFLPPALGGTPIGGGMDFFARIAPTGWIFPYGQELSRTTYAKYFAAATVTQSGARTNGSPTITGLSDTSLLEAGWPVSGTGIPGGTKILSIDSGTQVTLSANATASGTSNLVFAPFGVGDGSTTFNAPDKRGSASFGKDNMGGTSANRLTKPNAQGINGDILGATGGEEAHTMTAGELVTHLHAQASGTYVSGGSSPRNYVDGVSGYTTTASNTGNAGSSTPFNVLPPGVVCNYILFVGV